MSTADNANQPGRPPIRIDLSQAEQLCFIGACLREVAGWFKCSEDTIQRVIKEERGQTFTEFYDMYSAGGKISLRREQWRIAHGGGRDAAKMLMHLGKHLLDQIDKQQVDITTKGEAVAQPSLLGLLSLEAKKKLLEARRQAQQQEGGTGG